MTTFRILPIAAGTCSVEIYQLTSIIVAKTNNLHIFALLHQLLTLLTRDPFGCDQHQLTEPLETHTIKEDVVSIALRTSMKDALYAISPLESSL